MIADAPILAANTWATNAELIADVAALHIADDARVLDCTSDRVMTHRGGGGESSAGTNGRRPSSHRLSLQPSHENDDS